MKRISSILRIGRKPPRGQFQHGGGDALIVHRGQISRAAFQRRGLVTQKVRHVAHAGRIRFWVIRRLSRPRPRPPWPLRCARRPPAVGPGAAHLEAHRGSTRCSSAWARSSHCSIPQCVPCRQAVEKVPAHSDRGQPVGAAFIDELLAVRLKSRVKADLREQRAARRIRLCLGHGGRQMRRAAFRRSRRRPFRDASAGPADPRG